MSYLVGASDVQVFWSRTEGLAIALAEVVLDLDALEIELRARTDDDRDGALLHHFLPSKAFQYLHIPTGITQVVLIAHWRIQTRRGECFRFAIDLVPEEKVSPANSVWNIVLARAGAAPDGSALLETCSRERSTDPEQILRDHVEGKPLPVWAAAQVRQKKNTPDDRIIVSPTLQIWPNRHSRLSIEVPQAAGSLPGPLADRRQRNILTRAREEDAQRRVPRLLIRQLAGSRRIERMYGQYFIFALMQQRRSFANIEGQVVPDNIHQLFVDDPRLTRWLRLPENDQDHIAGFDFGRAVDKLDSGTDFDGPGAIARRARGAGPQDAVVEIEFPTVALGDLVGVLMPDDTRSSMSVVPDADDPRGGSPLVRMFQVDKAGLTPLAVDEEKPVLRELLNWARRFGRPGTQAIADNAHRDAHDLFVRELLSRVPNQMPVDGMNLTTLFASPFGPLPEIGFVNMLAAVPREGHAAVHQIGGFDAFLHEPSAVAAIAAAPHLASLVNAEALAKADGLSDGRGLVETLATLIEKEGFVRENPDPAQERATFRILCRDEVLVLALIDLRISLDGPAPTMERTANQLVTSLLEDRVRDATTSYLDRGQSAEAEKLAKYRANRQEGRWTPMQLSEQLALLVEKVAEYRKDFRKAVNTPLAAHPAPLQDVGQLRTQVKERLAQARQACPDEVVIYDGVNPDDLDRVLLADISEHLQQLLGSPAADEEVFTFIISRLDEWAGLPRDFAQSYAEYHVGPNGHGDARSAVGDFVNRLIKSVKEPQSRPFAAEWTAIRTCIRDAVDARAPFLHDRTRLEQDLRDYGLILFFHKARRAIDELVSRADGATHLQTQARRLRARLTAWPRDAAETWREAVGLGAGSIEPPDFNGGPA